MSLRTIKLNRDVVSRILIGLIASLCYRKWEQVAAQPVTDFLVRTLHLQTLWSYYAIRYVFLSMIVLTSLMGWMYFTRFREYRAILRDGGVVCGRCGYSLRGLADPQCPECGNNI